MVGIDSVFTSRLCAIIEIEEQNADPRAKRAPKLMTLFVGFKMIPIPINPMSIPSHNCFFRRTPFHIHKTRGIKSGAELLNKTTLTRLVLCTAKITKAKLIYPAMLRKTMTPNFAR